MWHGHAEIVARGIVSVRSFNMCDERGTEHLLAGTHGLQRDVVVGEYRYRRTPLKAIGCAIDVQRVGQGRQAARSQYQCADVDACDVAKSHHIFYASQLLYLKLGDRGALVHGRANRIGEPLQLTTGLQAIKEIVNGSCREYGPCLARHALENLWHKLRTRLDARTVEQPGITRHDPANRRRRDPDAQQPQAGIHAGLAGTDHRVVCIAVAQLYEIVQRHAGDTVCNREGRLAHRWHIYAHVGGVDDSAMGADVA